MRDDDHGPGAINEVSDTSLTPFSKRCIAHPEDFVDQQNFWLKRCCNRDPQSRLHPCGIHPKWAIKKMLEL